MLINMRTNAVVAQTVEIAATRETRNRGLLGRDRMDAGSALLISPCLAVHTAFMRFAIDVVFVDRNGCVVRIVRDLGPWRMAAAWRARRVIEMPAGEANARDLRVGDRLYLATGDAEDRSRTSSSAVDDNLRRTASKPACSGS